MGNQNRFIGGITKIQDALGVTINPAIEGGGFSIGTYDYVSLDSSTPGTEIWTFYIGGSGGTLLATITIVYTDSTKSTISTVTQT